MQALLFDLDGTLLDNMAHHDDALRQWHTRHGLALDTRQSFAATAGPSNEEYLRELFPETQGVKGAPTPPPLAQADRPAAPARSWFKLGALVGSAVAVVAVATTVALWKSNTTVPSQPSPIVAQPTPDVAGTPQGREAPRDRATRRSRHHARLLHQPAAHQALRASG